MDDPAGALDGDSGKSPGGGLRGRRYVTAGSIHLVRFHCKDSMVLMFYAMVRQDVGTPLGPPIPRSWCRTTSRALRSS